MEKSKQNKTVTIHSKQKKFSTKSQNSFCVTLKEPHTKFELVKLLVSFSPLTRNDSEEQLIQKYLTNDLLPKLISKIC